MDGQHFDALARQVGSRRTAIGAMLAGLLLPLEAAAHKQRRDKRKRGRGRRRGGAPGNSCWRPGACIPRIGANVSRCDLEGSTAFENLNCTGCNISRANLRGVKARGATLSVANLSGSCLVNADFTGATFAKTTNLANATFCRTIMPDGTVNNSGCGSDSECCPTCIQQGEACGQNITGSCCGDLQCKNGTCQPCTPETCASLGNVCGQRADGCGNTITCLCGVTSTPACSNGVCTSCSAVCGETCGCAGMVDGSTRCIRDAVADCNATCTTTADCDSQLTECVSTLTFPGKATFGACGRTTGTCMYLPAC